MTKRRRIIEGPKPLQPEEQPEKQQMKLMAMGAMAHLGVTPEEYASFLQDASGLLKEIDRMAMEAAEKYDEDDDPFMLFNERHGNGEKVTAMAGADSKTLRLKVQMQDVNKPPMWRELLVPAEFTFAQLHCAIQAATGLDDSHLWQFQRKAYRPDLQIGIPLKDDFGFGLEEWTHDANETPVTGFLRKKGDKLEYVYDFGDDWIFTVTVAEVLDREGDVAVCTKWKSDLQAIDDIGGTFAYCELREFVGQQASLKPKDKRKWAERFGFDTPEMFEALIDESMIDIAHVNEMLAEIPDYYTSPD